MPRANTRFAAVLGLVGVGLIVLGSLISGLAYVGRTGEGYSLLNHFVSELGDAPYARASWAFNGGLVIGGALLTVFMLGVAKSIDGWFRYIFGLVGLVAAVAGVLVGVFPMSGNVGAHAWVAMTFFNAGMVLTVLFSVYVLVSRRPAFPRWLAIPGGITAACFFGLLYLVPPLTPEGGSLEEALLNRPQVWTTAIVEWAVVIAVLGWVVAVSAILLRAGPAETG